VTRKLPAEVLPKVARVAMFVIAPFTLALASLSLANPFPPELRNAAHWRRLSWPNAVNARASAAPIASAETPRADATLDRAGRTLINRGVLFIPETFHSTDGSFDVLVFFHGNADLVVQSAAAAKLEAVVFVVNVGLGSGAYETHYGISAMFPHDLVRITETMASRGLVGARLGRLALGAWSAGYGAILRLLEQEPGRSKVSAVLLADALHSNLKDDGLRTVDLERMAPFVRYAQEAADEKKLFVMTHSEINEFNYATTTETADALISAVGTYRSRAVDWPERPLFPLARKVMVDDRWLMQRSEAHKGNFHVRGYRGFREDDHIAHLAQISSTLFADLVRYWSPTPTRWRKR
jgi:hypothetical protein